MKEKIRLVSLVGRGYIQRPYVERCIRSWQKIQGIESMPILVDAGMSGDEVTHALKMDLRVVSQNDERILEALKKYKALREIRKRFLTWKKVVDPIVLGEGCGNVLIIDTDVYVARKIRIPTEEYSFIYQCDDVPAYRGSWKLPLLEPMVYSLNAGFLIIEPETIDLEELEWIAEKYFYRCKRAWWTAQSMWSTIMARSGNLGIFDGRDMRTFSGSRKRTRKEGEENVVKFFGNASLIEDRKEALDVIKGLSVIHFAGKGKNWIDLVAEIGFKNSSIYDVGVKAASLASGRERAMISARMLSLQLRDWC